MNEGKTSDVGRITLTVILAILLFISAAAALVAADMRCFTRKETVRSIITEVVTGDDNAITAEIMDDVCNHAAEEINSRLELGPDKQVDPEELRELIAKSTLPDYLAEKISQSIDGTKPTVTKDEVHTLLEENKQVIEDAIGQPITDEMEREIMAWVEENGDEVIDRVQDELGQSTRPLPTPATGKRFTGSAPSLSSVFSKVSTAFSITMTVLIVCIVLCVLWTLLLIVVNRRYLTTGFCVSGAMYLTVAVIGALPLMLSSVLEKLIGGGLADILVSNMLLPIIVLLCLAAVLMICGIVLGVVKKNAEKV